MSKIALIVAFAVNQKGNNTTKNTEVSSTFSEYNDYIENKLINVIGNLDGVGKVNVAVTFSDFGEKIYVYETKTQVNGNVSTTTSSIVTVGGSPLVETENLPTVLGVVVVAEGADIPVVRIKIVQAVVTLLGIDSNLVEVFC